MDNLCLNHFASVSAIITLYCLVEWLLMLLTFSNTLVEREIPQPKQL